MARGHPIYAAHVRDYPEQVAVCGCKTGECPTCIAPPKELDLLALYSLPNLETILAALAKYETDSVGFTKACREAGIKPVIHPFWEDLPYCSIHLSIGPDILHQLLQGIIKHLIGWIKKAFGSAELDARCRSLLLNSQVCHFFYGICSLSRVTDKEHHDIACILFSIIIDLPLSGGQSPV